MTTRTVYPGVKPDGTRVAVLAQDGVTPIPDDGATVTNSEYYETLIAQQILIDYNPVLPAGPPVDLVIAPIIVTGTPTAGQVLEATGASTATWDDPSSGAIPTNLTAGLSGRAGIIDGELVHTAGYAAENDGGGDWFRFYLGVSSGANALDKINCSNGQWQKIRYGMVAMARSTTIRANGVADDTAALENVLLRLAKQGAVRDGEPGLPNTGPVLRLEPSDRVRLASGETIVLDPSVHCADMAIVGGGCRSTNDFGAVIYWDSAVDDKPMFDWGIRGGLFQGVFLSPHSGRDLLCAINWKYMAGDYGPGTALKIHGCNIRPFSDGTLQYGVVTDLDDATPQNLEDADFQDVYFSALEAAIWLKNGQPYNTTINKCLFEGHGAAPTGRGLWLAQGSSSVLMTNIIFGRISTGIALGSHGPVTLNGFDAERCKRLIGQANGSLASNSPNEGSPLTIIGGRVAANSYGLAAANPTIAAEEDTWIHAPFGLDSLSLNGVKFLSTANALPRWKIRLGPRASLDARACTFPNTRPVDLTSASDVSKVVFSACKGRNELPDGSPGNLYDELHSPGGTRSRDIVSVVIPAGFTSANVPWGRIEVTRPAVFPVVSIESGTPDPASLAAPAITSITTRGCVVTLAADPTPGDVRVDLLLRDPGASTALIGETAFTGGSTVRATAVSAGLRNFVWLAAYVHLNAVPNATEALTGCINGSNGFNLYGSGNGTTGSVYVARASGSGNTNSPTIALSSADVGKTHLYVWTMGGGTLRSYSARVEVGSGAAHTPAAAAAGTRHLFGTNSSGTEPTLSHWTILGVAGSDTGTTPTLTDVQTFFDAVAAARRLVVFPGSITTEHIWHLNGDATVADEVGADDVTLVSGTAPGTALVVPDLAWVA